MLSERKIKRAKQKEKAYKLSDAFGMYVLVTRSGKYFRYDFRFNNKRKTLAIGKYPDISLEEARARAREARELVKRGIDPVEYKRIAGFSGRSSDFKSVFEEWFLKQSAVWAESHAKKVRCVADKHLLPFLGNLPLSSISAPVLLEVLRRIESAGRLETAHRARGICSRVFRYAIATGRAERDPAQDLRGALAPVPARHYPAILKPVEVGRLLLAIEGYDGNVVVKYALRLAPLVFLRPGELRRGEWEEIDFDDAMWRIPGARMKVKNMPFHLVPLSRQAIAILRELHFITGHGRYLFPSVRTKDRPISDNTLNAALRRLGYSKDEMVAHGFRAIASTFLNELGWEPSIIERQLAHAERNSVRAAYNHAEYLSQRREMMQSWADHLGRLKQMAMRSFPGGRENGFGA